MFNSSTSPPRRSPRRRAAPRPRARPALSVLEGRLAPAVFTVTTLNDSGAGSLRDAIAQANASPGADAIIVQPGLAGTITLASALPAVSDDLTVTGPGAAALTVRRNSAAPAFSAASPPISKAPHFPQIGRKLPPLCLSRFRAPHLAHVTSVVVTTRS